MFEFSALQFSINCSISETNYAQNLTQGIVAIKMFLLMQCSTTDPMINTVLLTYI